MQIVNMHMQQMRRPSGPLYSAFMAKESSSRYKGEAVKAVAAWVDRVRSDLGWSKSEWAVRAGLSDTTVTRGMATNASSTPKLENLHALARAAGAPSVLDFLSGSTFQANVSEVSGVLAEILRSAPNWSAADAPRLAEGLLYGLGLATADPANPATAETLKVAGRAAADRLRDSKIEA